MKSELLSKCNTEQRGCMEKGRTMLAGIYRGEESTIRILCEILHVVSVCSTV